MDVAACARSAPVVRTARVAADRLARRPASVLGVCGALRQRAAIAALPRIAHRGRLSVSANAASGAAAGSSSNGSPNGASSKQPEDQEDIQVEAMPVWMPGPSDAPPSSWEKNPLKEFSKIPLDLVVLGTMWALFLSELLRFVCEAPVALPTKIIGGAMLAFCFNNGLLTGNQINQARLAEKAGQPADLYRLWATVKALAYLGGMATAVLKQEPALGMCLFGAGNIAFLTLNAQTLSRGAAPKVLNLEAPARKLFKTIALLDLALLALALGSRQLLALGYDAAACVPAGLVALFAAYQCFQIYVKKKQM